MNSVTDLQIAMSCVYMQGSPRDQMTIFMGISRHRSTGASRDSDPIWARISSPIPEYASRHDFLEFFDESDSLGGETISIRNPIAKIPETSAERDAIRQAVAQLICRRPHLLLRAMVEFHETGCDAGSSQAPDVRYSLKRIRGLLAQSGMQYDTRTLAKLGAMRCISYLAEGIA